LGRLNGHRAPVFELFFFAIGWCAIIFGMPESCRNPSDGKERKRIHSTQAFLTLLILISLFNIGDK
jgi:amino acid permease